MKSVNYQMLVNGEKVGLVIPNRGLRESCYILLWKVE